MKKISLILLVLALVGASAFANLVPNITVRRAGLNNRSLLVIAENDCHRAAQNYGGNYCLKNITYFSQESGVRGINADCIIISATGYPADPNACR